MNFMAINLKTDIKWNYIYNFKTIGGESAILILNALKILSVV